MPPEASRTWARSAVPSPPGSTTWPARTLSRPASRGPGRTVPACSDDARKVDNGIEPELRNVEVNGRPVSYVNAGFAPAYWGGFGFGPGLFTGFLLGEALSPFP